MSIKDKLETAGGKVVDTAKDVGHKIADKAEQAYEWVREKAGATKPDIKPKMDVIASCGTRVGAVDHSDGDSIKLTRSDPTAGGVHHFVPLSWVQRVDSHVHLTKNSEETRREWKTEGA